jgi:hypothetical protein
VVRPYEGAGAVVAGYRKNLLAGLGRRRWLAGVGVLGLLAAYLGPSSIFAAAVLSRAPALAASAGVVVALQLLLRARLERADGRSPWIALLDPVAGLAMAVTLGLSAFGGSTTWKGRRFVTGRARP